ncbi:hypothetical protein J6Q66_05245 [bacterium]|nr:hypothetical protein [bacterium]
MINKCIHCGSNNVRKTNELDEYECMSCGTLFTDDDVVTCDCCGEIVCDVDAVYYDKHIFCCDDCLNEFNFNN